jgi:hypothetical protein
LVVRPHISSPKLLNVLYRVYQNKIHNFENVLRPNEYIV